MDETTPTNQPPETSVPTVLSTPAVPLRRRVLKPPGPGIFGAILWVILFFAVQIMGVIIASGMDFTLQVTSIPRAERAAFLDAQSEALQNKQLTEPIIRSLGIGFGVGQASVFLFVILALRHFDWS